MKKFLCVALAASFIMLCGCTRTVQVNTISGEPQPAMTAADLPKKKQTVPGLYLTAREAYEKWKADPDNIRIVDCRTPEEYMFVGHAPMALNIPKKFLKYQWDAEKKKPVMTDNTHFIGDAKKKLRPGDTIFVMCRSGARSAMTVNALAGAGFKNVYNIIDGFEGDKIKDPGSYFDGKRMRNGWKNSGAPWTCALNPELIYLP
ncbi:sulfurtransferase [Desulfonema ishimotonii]|uniref:Sulfurtransferase n=1 Tax=Desulfonema ishimotonii TaxID=45657 RepID=A0A401FY88_9BACT|nr:rhodanese-like domain-containing protein [Desulfonema ishimotonii]GBC61938.1 sulfurtransferase [Desulfonema ishimotonii]